MLQDFIENDITSFLERKQTRLTRELRQSNTCPVKLSRLSKKFNLLMQHMFSFNTEVNLLIHNQEIDIIIVLKYLIWAHDFIAKFENEIDEMFSSVLLSNDSQLGIEFLAKMDIKFQNFAIEKNLINEKATSFMIVDKNKESKLLNLLMFRKTSSNASSNEAYIKMQNFINTLIGITGLLKINIEIESDERSRKVLQSCAKEDKEIDFVKNFELFNINFSGLSTSISLGQILLGSTDFLNYVLDRFD